MTIANVDSEHFYLERHYPHNRVVEHILIYGGINLYTEIDDDYVTMVFYELKNTWHQPEPTACVPTILKVLFENQFKISLSMQQWKNRTKWESTGVVPLAAIRGLNQYISEYKIEVVERTGLTEKDIVKLLNESKLPFIYLRMNYMDSKNIEPCIDEEGTNWKHPVIPVGVEDEKVFLCDPLEKSHKTLTKKDIKHVLTVPRFLKEWEHNQRRAFWFQNISKKDKELSEFTA